MLKRYPQQCSQQARNCGIWTRNTSRLTDQQWWEMDKMIEAGRLPDCTIDEETPAQVVDKWFRGELTEEEMCQDQVWDKTNRNVENYLNCRR